MAPGRSSSNTLVLFTLAVSLLASAVNAAVIGVRRIPNSAIFYNPRKAELFYYPRTTAFTLAQCGPRDDQTVFSVRLERRTRAYVVSYLYGPSDTDNKARFQNLRSINLNLTTGALSVSTWGVTINVNLKTYLRTDILQPDDEGRDLFGQDVYAYDATVNKLSDKLVDLDGLVTESLKLLATTARFFDKDEVPYLCRERTTTTGHPTLKNLADYLTTLSELPTPRCTTTLSAWSQCGGRSSPPTPALSLDSQWPGYCCASGFTCARQHEWYWQCLEA